MWLSPFVTAKLFHSFHITECKYCLITFIGCLKEKKKGIIIVLISNWRRKYCTSIAYIPIYFWSQFFFPLFLHNYTHTFWVFLTWNLISKTDDSGKILSYTFISHTCRQTQAEEIHFLCKMKTENLAKIFFHAFLQNQTSLPCFKWSRAFR